MHPTSIRSHRRGVAVLVLLVGCARPAATTSVAGDTHGTTAPTPGDRSPSEAVDGAMRDASAAALHGEILGCVLAHPDVRAYVHPEHPGRVPVTVHVDRSIAVGVPPTAYGHAVEWSTPAASLVDIASLRLAGDEATVALAIDEEGVRGTVACTRGDGGWVPGAAALAEH